MVADAEKLRVFISYSRDDLDFADQLDFALDGIGFNATVDRHGIAGADPWKRRLGELIRDADTVVFVLSPSSARSEICQWEVTEATRLGKRIIPVICRPIGDTHAPEQLTELNYIHFYGEPKVPGSGFGSGLIKLVAALNEDPVWLREHTRLLGLASSWDAAGRPTNRLLSGDDINKATEWLTERRRSKTEPTELHLAYIRVSDDERIAKHGEARKQLEERERLVRNEEAALAERAAAQQLALDANSRAIRSTRIGAFAAICLAIGVGFFGWKAQINAQRADFEAQSARENLKLVEAEADRSEAILKIGRNIEERRFTGKVSSAGRLIFYGDAEDYETSTVAILYSEGGQRYLCTGVVISPSTVLTTGHCSCGYDYTIAFGAEVEKSAFRVVAHAVRRFPGYNCGTQSVQKGIDFAVLIFDPATLPKTVEVGSIFSIARIIHPDAATSESLSLRAVGYGLNQTQQTGAKWSTQMTIQSPSCSEAWANDFGCAKSTEFLLSDVNYRKLSLKNKGKLSNQSQFYLNACDGDTGAAAFSTFIQYQKDGPTRKSFLVGLASRGVGGNSSLGSNAICGGGAIFEFVGHPVVQEWLKTLNIDLKIEEFETIE